MPLLAGISQVGLCRSCLDKVCARCSYGSDHIADDESVRVDGEPFCAQTPFGFRAPIRGTTLSSVYVEKGYYRISSLSTSPVKCFLNEACIGGNEAGNYCARGYMGPCEFGLGPRLCAENMNAISQEREHITRLNNGYSARTNELRGYGGKVPRG